MIHDGVLVVAIVFELIVVEFEGGEVQVGRVATESQGSLLILG